MKPSVPALIFSAGLAAGLWLALTPNVRGEMHFFLPMELRHWVHEHDDFANIAAFLCLAIFGLCFQRNPQRGGKSAARPAMFRLLEKRAVRVAGLMALVCAIEIVQIFIPGRVADLQDVCTGWSGIFAAWLLSVILDVRAKFFPPTASSAE